LSKQAEVNPVKKLLSSILVSAGRASLAQLILVTGDTAVKHSSEKDIQYELTDAPATPLVASAVYWHATPKVSLYPYNVSRAALTL